MPYYRSGLSLKSGTQARKVCFLAVTSPISPSIQSLLKQRRRPGEESIVSLTMPGVGVAQRGDLLEVTSESFDRCIRVNTKAVFFLCQVVARHMLKQGEIGGQHRSIINVTSSNAVAVSISRGEYCVSKSASSMTTRLFGVRLAAEGIGVYEVRPGIIETDMTRPVKDKYDALIADSVPAQRWGFPADVAATVRSMAEGHLTYTVGQAVTVDGGLTIPRF
jgi:3-oxoacyl-[acyl-carrier protein] reductase